MLPSSFHPAAPTDFIGSARRIALRLASLITESMATGAPIRLLLLGKPGIGKTSLSNYFLNQIGADKWHTSALNGTQVKIELVEEIARSLQLRDLFGKYRVIRIEEVDKVPVVAQVRLLTVIDELPPYSAVIATSNCSLKELEERFGSRFLKFDVSPPPDSEIFGLLQRLCTGRVDEPSIKRIATFCCGNVRAALLEADGAILQLAA